MTCDVCGERIPFGVCCDAVCNELDDENIERGRE
jgi:hypothetical protein